jgi:hypothetical protein
LVRNIDRERVAQFAEIENPQGGWDLALVELDDLAFHASVVDVVHRERPGSEGEIEIAVLTPEVAAIVGSKFVEPGTASERVLEPGDKWASAVL